MTSKRWEILPPPGQPAEELAAALHISPVVARLLLSRGCGDEAAANRFLNPSLDDLHDPFDLPDMEAACARIARAIEAGERICIHGDYDVDGVCAAALLTRTLRTLNANVGVCVPHRQLHGYDLQPESVERLHAEGVKLIVTVDCGIVAFPALERANQLGIDVIVTDHHLPGPRLPAAAAVVNPKREDSRYPFAELCGTGIAYKLATALLQHLGIHSAAFRTVYLDMVALATVADCMPLRDENRAFVKFGLQRLRGTKNAGLKALMNAAGIRPETLSARSLGFALGPRINAVGRLDAAEHALQLLITDNAAEAQALAEKLDRFNRERQQEQERIFEEAMRQAQGFVHDRILVLASARWHPGVIGTVASRMVEAQHRPAVLIALNEEASSGRGSARSVDGYHIFAALSRCAEHLGRCGGHQAAAGFDIQPDRVEPLRDALRAIAEENLPDELLQPCLRAEAELALAEITLDLCRELEKLEPFGHANPRPLFVSRRLQVARQTRISASRGAGPDHLKLFVSSGAGRPLEAVYWRGWPRSEACPAGCELDLCYELEVNEWQGTCTVQMTVSDFRAADA